MSLSLLNFLGDSQFSSSSSSVHSSERLGLGTTGLGAACNRSLAKDSDHSIKAYLAKKNSEKQAREREEAAKGGRPLKRQEQQALMRQLQEKLDEKREAERALCIQERQAAESKLKQDREQALQEARRAVEQEKLEARRRKELYIQQQQEKEEQKRQRIQEEMAMEREMLREAEESRTETFQMRQERLRNLRELQRSHLEKENEARQRQNNEAISQEKKKLAQLRQEGRSFHQSFVLSIRDEIKTERAERTKKEQRQKELQEKERELLAERKSQEKKESKQQKEARLQAELQEKQQMVHKVKADSTAARKQLMSRQEEWLETMRSGSDSGKPPTSPMFPQLRSFPPPSP